MIKTQGCKRCEACFHRQYSPFHRAVLLPGISYGHFHRALSPGRFKAQLLRAVFAGNCYGQLLRAVVAGSLYPPVPHSNRPEVTSNRCWSRNRRKGQDGGPPVDAMFRMSVRTGRWHPIDASAQITKRDLAPRQKDSILPRRRKSLRNHAQSEIAKCG